MTIVAVANTLEGIAMSADGRLVQVREHEGVDMYFPVSDTVSKIVLLRHGTVGVTFFGSPYSVGNETVKTLIENLDKSIRKKDTVKHISERISKDILYKYDLEHLNFYVAGYDRGSQSIYHVCWSSVEKMNHNDSSYSMWFGGDIDRVKFVLETFDFDPAFTPLEDILEITKLAVDFTIRYNQHIYLNQSCGGNVDNLLINEKGARMVTVGR